MVRVGLIIAFSLLLVCQSFGQSIEDLAHLDVYSKDSLRLFDGTAIKEKNITRAYLVQISREFDRKGRWLKNDTCSIFEFNKKGEAIRRIDYHKPFEGDDWTDTISLPQKIEYHPYGCNKMITRITNLRSGKSVTQYLFLTYEGKSDTALIITTKYNRRNQIVEESTMPTKWYFKFISCRVDQPPYRFKYSYDEKARISYHRDFYEKDYLRISYPYYGELIKRFDAKTNRLISEAVNTITRTEDINSSTTTITTAKAQVIITKHQEDGNLIRLITVVRNSAFPEVKYYRITYE